MITASEAIIGSLLVAIVILLATDPSRDVVDPQPFQIASVPVATPRPFTRVMPASISQASIPQDTLREDLERRIEGNTREIKSVVSRVDKLEDSRAETIKAAAVAPAETVEPEVVYSEPVRESWSVSPGGGSNGQVSRVYQSFPQPVVSGSSTGNYRAPVQRSNVYRAPARTWSNQTRQTPIKSAIRFNRPQS